MTVRREETPRGPRIVIAIGSEDHVSVERAIEIRDGITQAIAAPQALTDREAMVWAARFVAERMEGRSAIDAAIIARDDVLVLRDRSEWANAGARVLPADARAMLAAMTEGGR